MTICLLDTSVLLNLLEVRGFSQQKEQTVRRLEILVSGSGSDLLLPFASVMETGNHIAQLADGADRRAAAQRFVGLVQQTLANNAPWVATPFPDQNRVTAYLDEFPDCAMRGIGFADLSIVDEWRRQRARWPKRRVLIWSYDAHLAGYDSGNGLW